LKIPAYLWRVALRAGTRIGGRGCPSCGGHITDSMAGHGQHVSWCAWCGHRWVPCVPGCRGYRLDVHATDGPVITGCRECGVPDVIARRWPEAWRAMANRLSPQKMLGVEDTPKRRRR
jgi:hypothetical protein